MFNLKLKIETWNNLTEDFCDSISTLNIGKAESLLNKGCPLYIHSYFTEDEQCEMGEMLFENLADQAENNLTKSLESLFISENKDEMFELLASYLMFLPREVRFRKNYFIYTNNFENVKKYTDNLFNTLTFLKDERINWMTGVLYNKNDIIFNYFFEVYNSNKIEGKDINVLLGRKLHSDKYYNINSWKKYYEEYFGSFLDYSFNQQNNSEYDSASDVFFDLIKYPLELFEEDKSKKLVEPIVDFLVKDYAYFTDIEQLDYMMIALCYEKEKKLENDLENSNKQKSIRRRLNILSRHFSSLSSQTKLDIVKNMLNKNIDIAIKKNNSLDCLSFFKSINLPEEKYEILNSYINLKNEISNKDIITKKINKI